MNLTESMKKIAASLAALLISAAGMYAARQDTFVLKGTVRDAQGNPVQYATVAVTDSAGIVIAGATSAEDGTFEISARGTAPEESWDLICSFVGYKDLREKVASMTEAVSPGAVILKDAVLAEDSEALAGAVVSGKRELIEHHFDKLVLNVSELAVAKTGNAMDVLMNSPGVTVDKDGNVKLNGQTVSVWIDGRPSTMSGKDLEVFLKGSPGYTIEKVELMSSPSAKYDAEGSGGIINIKTRKGFMQGLSGSLTANGSIRLNTAMKADMVKPGGDLSANLMYKTDKTLTSFSYSPNYGEGAGVADENKWYGTDYSSLRQSQTTMDNSWGGHNLRLQNDWNVTKKDVIGVIANFRTSSEGSDSGDGSRISDYRSWGTPGQELYSSMLSNTLTDSRRRFIYANLNYTHVFDESRSAELTVNADYSRNAGKEKSEQKNIWQTRPASVLPGGTDLSGEDFSDYGFSENTERVLDLVSLKADYSTVFWKSTGRIEAGLKGAVSLTDNRFSRFEYDPSSWSSEEKPSRVNNFKYREQIYAAYLNVAKQFSPKLNAQVGLRGEMTFSKGMWQDDPHTSDNYFDLFPNATLSWIPSQKFIFSANYSYRISRPTYWKLNPFITYLNATTYTQGKADLKPSYSHNVSLTAVLFGRLSISSGYGNVRNYSDLQVPRFETESGKMGLVYDNAGVQDVAYVSLSLSEQPITKWWTVTFTGNYSYTHFKAYEGVASGLSEGYVNDGHAFYAYASTTFWLPKNFKTGLSGFYCTPQTAGFYDVSAMWTLNFDFSKTFLDGKLALNLYVGDIFGSLNSDISLYDKGKLSYSLEQNFSNRTFRLGLTWRFGQSVSSRRKVGNLDESSRM